MVIDGGNKMEFENKLLISIFVGLAAVYSVMIYDVTKTHKKNSVEMAANVLYQESKTCPLASKKLKMLFANNEYAKGKLAEDGLNIEQAIQDISEEGITYEGKYFSKAEIFYAQNTYHKKDLYPGIKILGYYNNQDGSLSILYNTWASVSSGRGGGGAVNKTLLMTLEKDKLEDMLKQKSENNN